MSAADKLMRKASARFAKGKIQDAHDVYGEAARRYGPDARDVEGLRAALALYTRAMFVLAGDAQGDATEDVRAGLALMEGRDDAEARRFRGLFSGQAGVIAARDTTRDLTEATSAFGAARSLLAAEGRPHDRVELERTAALALSGRGEEAAAREAAEAAVVAAGDDRRLVVHARRTLADIHEAAGRIEDAIDALSTAFQVASGREFHATRNDLDDRITELRKKSEA